MLSYWSGVATLTGIYLIATLGVSILVGFTGLFSLGHAGFMAIGAYGTALSIKLLHMPFFPACLMGILAAMLAGGLIGRATLRLKGDYFVIATLAIGECTKLLIENISEHYRRIKRLDRYPEENEPSSCLGDPACSYCNFEQFPAFQAWTQLHCCAGRRACGKVNRYRCDSV